MIATAKFTAALQRSKASRPFTDQIRQLVGEVAGAAGDVEHPLLRGPAEPVNRELLLVIGSDRGLCGVYNWNVLRMSARFINDLRTRQVSYALEVSGRKPLAFLRFNKIEVGERHTIGDKPTYEQVEAIAQRYVDEFAQGRYDAIRVAYMRYVSNSRQVPELMQLLPVSVPQESEQGGA